MSSDDVQMLRGFEFVRDLQWVARAMQRPFVSIEDPAIPQAPGSVRFGLLDDDTDTELSWVFSLRVIVLGYIDGWSPPGGAHMTSDVTPEASCLIAELRSLADLIEGHIAP